MKDLPMQDLPMWQKMPVETDSRGTSAQDTVISYHHAPPPPFIHLDNIEMCLKVVQGGVGGGGGIR